MLGMGYAMMGTASATGENAALIAAEKAISCPLMEAGGVRGARGVLINITGSSRLSLHEVNEACSLIREAAQNEDVQINFGVVMNETMGDEVKITVIATGFQRENLPVIERKGARPAAAVSAPVVEIPPPLPASAPAVSEEPEYPEEPIAAEPVAEEAPMSMAAAASASHKQEPKPEPTHEQMFDDLDVPAILRKRMVQ